MEEESLSFTKQLDRNHAELTRGLDCELAELTREFDELRKDKERLDWLLSEDSNTNIEVGRYGRGDEYKPWVVDALHNRADIDAAMKGTI